MITLYGAFYDLTIKGVAKLGQDYTREEAMDYLHLWNVVGYFLGVDESLLCIDDDKWEFTYNKMNEWFYKHEYLVDENTKKLTSKLIEFQKELIPFKFADDLSYSFLRYFMGDQYCDNLGIPQGCDIDKLMIIYRFFYGVIDEMGDRNETIQKIIGKISNALIDNWFTAMNEDQRIPFYLYTLNLREE